MRTHVGLLRGINVGTAKQVGMADLVAVVQGEGYGEVATLLRSGNVVLAAPSGLAPDAAQRLEAALLAATGVRSSWVLLPVAALEEALAADPLGEVATDPSRRLLTFLGDALPAGVVPPEGIEPDVVVLGDRVVYSWHPDGVSRSRVPPAWWRSLGPAGTARNRTTCERLLALAHS